MFSYFNRILNIQTDAKIKKDIINEIENTAIPVEYEFDENTNKKLLYSEYSFKECKELYAFYRHFDENENLRFKATINSSYLFCSLHNEHDFIERARLHGNSVDPEFNNLTKFEKYISFEKIVRDKSNLISNAILNNKNKLNIDIGYFSFILLYDSVYNRELSSFVNFYNNDNPDKFTISIKSSIFFPFGIIYYPQYNW